MAISNDRIRSGYAVGCEIYRELLMSTQTDRTASVCESGGFVHNFICAPHVSAVCAPPFMENQFEEEKGKAANRTLSFLCSWRFVHILCFYDQFYDFET